jgi:hypothetical protein
MLQAPPKSAAAVSPQSLQANVYGVLRLALWIDGHSGRGRCCVDRRQQSACFWASPCSSRTAKLSKGPCRRRRCAFSGFNPMCGYASDLKIAIALRERSAVAVVGLFAQARLLCAEFRREARRVSMQSLQSRRQYIGDHCCQSRAACKSTPRLSSMHNLLAVRDVTNNGQIPLPPTNVRSTSPWRSKRATYPNL